MTAAAVSSSAARAPQTIVAFDFGTRRIGVAIGNALLQRARPLRTIAGGARPFDEIAALLREWQPDALVVGVPFHPDGAPHLNTEAARRFARRLRGRFGLPVFEVDERWTTTEARAGGAADVDAAAAALILDQHLRSLG
jgi:putative Holliday junction resolvase